MIYIYIEIEIERERQYLTHYYILYRDLIAICCDDPDMMTWFWYVLVRFTISGWIIRVPEVNWGQCRLTVPRGHTQLQLLRRPTDCTWGALQPLLVWPTVGRPL